MRAWQMSSGAPQATHPTTDCCCAMPTHIRALVVKNSRALRLCGRGALLFPQTGRDECQEFFVAHAQSQRDSRKPLSVATAPDAELNGTRGQCHGLGNVA